MKTLSVLLAATIILVSGLTMTQAQNETIPASEESGEGSFTVESVSGEVSGIGKNYISIVYDKDYDKGEEFEMMIPIDAVKKPEFKHKKDLSEIKKGDLVSVEFIKPEKGKYYAKTINFVQSGVDKLATDAMESDSSVATDQVGSP